MDNYSNFADESFECELVDGTAIIRLKQRAFSVNFETTHLHKFLNCLNSIEMDDKVKGVLLIDPPSYHGVQNVKDFIELLNNTKGSYQKEKGVTRYGNSSKRITLTLNGFSKPIVAAIDGSAPIDSFGYFMACDNIIATNDLTIEFPGLALGVIPIGAVSYFLEKEIGPRKTLDMFLSGSSLDGKAALDLGIVTQLVEKDKLIEVCLDKLEHYCAQPEQTVIMTKQLIKARNYELEHFFERSIPLMWNAILNK